MKKFSEKKKTSLRIAAIRFGEDLMPCDCADILEKRYCLKTRKAIGVKEIAAMIQDMMESASFVCDYEDAIQYAEWIA